jgi:hypothetical protein
MRHPQNDGTAITQDTTAGVTWANGNAKIASPKFVEVSIRLVRNLVS